jgi:hypothetical protein
MATTSGDCTIKLWDAASGPLACAASLDLSPERIRPNADAAQSSEFLKFFDRSHFGRRME